MQEIARYLQWLWPTLKKVQGYDEEEEDVMPRILATRDSDHRQTAKQLVYRLSYEMPGWSPDLLTSYRQEMEQEALTYVRELQFTDSKYTYEQYRDDTNTFLAEAGLVL